MERSWKAEVGLERSWKIKGGLERSWKIKGRRNGGVGKVLEGRRWVGPNAAPIWGRRAHLWGNAAPSVGSKGPYGVGGSIWGRRLPLFGVDGPYGVHLWGSPAPLWGRRVHMGSEGPFGVHLWGNTAPLWGQRVFLGSEGPYGVYLWGNAAPLWGRRVLMGFICGAMLPPGGQSPLLLWGRRLPLFGVGGPIYGATLPPCGVERPIWGPYGVHLWCNAAPWWPKSVTALGSEAAPIWGRRSMWGRRLPLFGV